MKQHGKHLAGFIAAGLLALSPLGAQSQSQSPQAQGQGHESGQSSSSQGVAGQRQSGQDQSQRQSGSKNSSAHDETGSANRMGADSTFLTKAAVGGMAEVKLGHLATQNASNADVKAFGQQMVDDHGKANN